MENERSDDPDYQAKLRYLYDWLLDGRELKKLLAIAEKAKAHPRKRRSRRYAVRRADGSIFVPKQRSAKKRVVPMSRPDKQRLRSSGASGKEVRH